MTRRARVHKNRIAAAVHSRIPTLLRLALGVVFCYASLDKIVDPAGFAEAVANYRLLPGALVPAMAIVLPWLELICGVLLILGRLTGGAAALVSVLMLLFIGALGLAMLRGIDIACGCFSNTATGSVPLWLDLIRDLVLLAAALYVLQRQAQVVRTV